MFNKRLIVFVVFASLCLAIGCPGTKKTGLKGTLILQVGQTGDVRNTKVQLYEKSDLTGSPVMEVASEYGTDATRSDFEFENVIPGYYYVLAWKDLTGDGVINANDIAGVHGGTYYHGYGGTQVTVQDGKVTDVGEIVMLIVVPGPADLAPTASGVRTQNNTQTTFTYSFNYDNYLDRLYITFPGDATEYEDTYVRGNKTANTQYTTTWNAGGATMPSGSHYLRFVGTINQQDYEITVEVAVGKSGLTKVNVPVQKFLSQESK